MIDDDSWQKSNHLSIKLLANIGLRSPQKREERVRRCAKKMKPLFCILHNCQMIDYRSANPLLYPGFVLCGVFANSTLMICWFLVSDPCSSLKGVLPFFNCFCCQRIVPNFGKDTDLCWQTKTKKRILLASLCLYQLLCLSLWVSIYCRTNPIVMNSLGDFISFLFAA